MRLWRCLAQAAVGLALLAPWTIAPSAGAQPAAQGAPAGVISAAPGRSGGEGGGSGVNTTLREATKADPILKSSVGQPSGPPTGDDPT